MWIRTTIDFMFELVAAYEFGSTCKGYRPREASLRSEQQWIRCVHERSGQTILFYLE